MRAPRPLPARDRPPAARVGLPAVAAAAERLARVGPNRLTRAARPAYATIAARQLLDPLVGLLVVAAAVSFAIGDRVEGSAIEEGRAIADNIRKFVAFLLSANLGEVALFAVAIPAGLGIPMTVVQVLVVNVLTDGLPAVALARDPPAPFALRRPPDRSNRLFPPLAWAALAGIGLLVGATALGAYLLGRPDGPDRARTMAFATVALAELALVYSVRSSGRRAVDAPRNRSSPEAASSRPAWSPRRSTGLALAPFVAVELAKALSRRTGRAIDPDHPE